jgi:hypothetical protein
MIGRRLIITLGNSIGEPPMPECMQAGNGARFSVLLLPDDANREFAHGPAQGLPDSGIGTFPQPLFDQAKE